MITLNYATLINGINYIRTMHGCWTPEHNVLGKQTVSPNSSLQSGSKNIPCFVTGVFEFKYIFRVAEHTNSVRTAYVLMATYSNSTTPATATLCSIDSILGRNIDKAAPENIYIMILKHITKYPNESLCNFENSNKVTGQYSTSAFLVPERC